MARNCLAIDTLGFFGEELDEGCTITDLAFGLGQWFTHFGGQNSCEVIGVLDHQIKPAAQHGGALFACPFGPVFLRNLGGGDSLCDLCARQVGDLSNDITSGGVNHIKCALSVDPCAVHIGLRSQERRVFEQGFEVCWCIKHSSLRAIVSRQGKPFAHRFVQMI